MRSNAFYLAPVSIFERLKVSPTLLTIIGTVITSSSGYLFATGHFLTGAIVLGLGSLFDLFDGELARRTNRVTRFGGFIDSNLDRVSEFSIYLGLFLYYSGPVKTVIFLAFAFSQLVSYARARAEGGGYSCRGGLFTRGVRFFLLFFGGLAGPQYMRYFLMAIALGAFITLIQRIWIVGRQKI
ncbi:CDP-alcohol phosphatidyltransferase family protein [candidate division WOR-3 bacterium]|uniref:CDP-alcohol phosphatidyltransferase family protein n=1 Tax=candidate division WOR-3 bacterium TaxID=2052148 RepID=A0A660SIC3_UNCW3|nr:MAG: CDP-alcohol phosphatidyltransferase family protein [candidate division WOR-3 bacterium]